MRNDYLLDKDFLKEVDTYYQREVYAKLISLDFDENPIAEIMGNVSQGTININGDSAVRRTCNLTLVAGSVQVNEVDWALRTKFKLYVGLKNYIDTEKYDDILWFNQGIYIITSFSSQINQQGYTITIQGKDKMCLLNGDISGNLFAAHDFGKEYMLRNDGTTDITEIPIHKIIREAVHVYALEPYSNIMINDLEGCSVELLDYKGKGTDLYIIETIADEETGTPTTNMYFGRSRIAQYIENNIGEKAYDGYTFNFEGRPWTLIKKVTSGDTVGYRLTELTYPGDLIAAVGETLTSVLDKIVELLGEFEYYYDVNGTFIFQRKKINYNIPWTNVVMNEDQTYYENAATTSASVYNFNQGFLVESFQNKPAINNIKNDFAIWGMMQGINSEIPIHLRYAIDEKPKMYYSLSKKTLFKSTEEGGVYDWRELIYQMAYDNNIYHGEMEDQRLLEIEQSVELTEDEKEYLLTWNTGYDAYYADMLGFWRMLYNPEDGTWTDNNFWSSDYFIYDNDKKQLEFKEPKALPFWIDFIDTTTELGKYSVSNIGRRTKVVNDSDVKAIFFRETPNILFVDPQVSYIDDNSSFLSYIRFNIPPSLENYFVISSQGKSAKETLDNLVYQHTYYQESITMSVVPIYYLEPNTRISIEDEASGISGEYLIKSLSISLAHDGMTSITATRAAERIL